MKKMLLWAAVLAMLMAGSLWAQDISGDWQGTLKLGRDLRIILHIEKGDKGAFTCKLYSIDQGVDAVPATSIVLKESAFKATFDLIMASYEGQRRWKFHYRKLDSRHESAARFSPRNQRDGVEA